MGDINAAELKESLLDHLQLHHVLLEALGERVRESPLHRHILEQRDRQHVVTQQSRRKVRYLSTIGFLAISFRNCQALVALELYGTILAAVAHDVQRSHLLGGFLWIQVGLLRAPLNQHERDPLGHQYEFQSLLRLVDTEQHEASECVNGN